jgi:hypothetical protein
MAGKKPPLAGEIAELYGQPLDGWTAARNALAKRLSGEGRKVDGGTIKLLRKPSLSAWAVNQLFREEGERMGELLAAGKRARAAQGQAVAGRGADTFREALGIARRQIEDLRRRAVALLGKDGKGAGAAIAERIGRNLEALAFSPAAAAEGARGYLDADLDPPGFEVLSGVRWSAPASGSRGEPEPPSPPRRPAVAKDSEEPSRLLHFKSPNETPPNAPKETRAQVAARKRGEAEAARQARALARQRERIERAESALREAKEKVTALRAEAKTAEGVAAEARRQAAAAEHAADAVVRRAEAAEGDLARAEERLEIERSGGGLDSS